MAISSGAQENNLLGIIVSLFNASPGNKFLEDFSAQLENGLTEAQLADTLAASTAFTSGIMGGKPTVAAQVTELMNHYGLIADNVPGSPATQAQAFFTDSINSNVGFGHIALLMTNFLLGPSIPPEFVETANLFKNKIAVASLHSQAIVSQDLNTLQVPMLIFDEGKASIWTDQEITDHLVSSGILFNLDGTTSITIDQAAGSSSPIDPFGIINTPDDFTLNVNNVSGEHVIEPFSVTPLNCAGTNKFTLKATVAHKIDIIDMMLHGFENISIIANSTNPGSLLATRIFAPEAQTVTITGDSAINLTENASNENELAIGNVNFIDAGGSTGNIIVNFKEHKSAVTYLGSGGRDLYVGSKGGGEIDGGLGTDFFILEEDQAARDTLILSSADEAQIVDTNADGRFTILQDNMGFEMVENFSAANDLYDLAGFGFVGAQQDVTDASAKVPTFDTDLTSIPDLFVDATGVDRGAAFSVIPLLQFPGEVKTILFVDANKDGNFTAADDIVLELSGTGPLTEANFVF